MTRESRSRSRRRMSSRRRRSRRQPKNRGTPKSSTTATTMARRIQAPALIWSSLERRAGVHVEGRELVPQLGLTAQLPGRLEVLAPAPQAARLALPGRARRRRSHADNTSVTVGHDCVNLRWAGSAPAEHVGTLPAAAVGDAPRRPGRRRPASGTAQSGAGPCGRGRRCARRQRRWLKLPVPQGEAPTAEATAEASLPRRRASRMPP